MIKGFFRILALLAGPIILILMIASVARADYPKGAAHPDITRHSRCMEIANVGAAALASRFRAVPKERVLANFQQHDVGYRKAIRDAYSRSYPPKYKDDPAKGHAAYRQRVYKECQKGLY